MMVTSKLKESIGTAVLSPGSLRAGKVSSGRRLSLLCEDINYNLIEHACPLRGRGKERRGEVWKFSPSWRRVEGQTALGTDPTDPIHSILNYAHCILIKATNEVGSVTARKIFG